MTIIGVDFDNTIVCYDRTIRQAALDLGLIKTQDADGSKTAIRDRIRHLDDGDRQWQVVQALAYGTKIAQAELFDGVLEFFRRCKARNIRTYIVSHKTEFSSIREMNVNLREAAWKFMDQNAFFDEEKTGLTRGQVFFADTREEKVAKLQALGCKVFIDDLIELFMEPYFPGGVEKILLSGAGKVEAPNDIRQFTNWQQISGHIFANDAR